MATSDEKPTDEKPAVTVLDEEDPDVVLNRLLGSAAKPKKKELFGDAAEAMAALAAATASAVSAITCNNPGTLGQLLSGSGAVAKSASSAGPGDPMALVPLPPPPILSPALLCFPPPIGVPPRPPPIPGASFGSASANSMALVPMQHMQNGINLDHMMEDAGRRYLAELNGDMGAPSMFDQGGIGIFGAASCAKARGPSVPLMNGPLGPNGSAQPLATWGGREPKTVLNEFCLKTCRRPMTKTDVVYTCRSHGRNRWQATVTLACLNGAEFAGEICVERKIAEKAAAVQALHFYMDGGAATVMQDGVKGRSGLNFQAGIDAVRKSTADEQARIALATAAFEDTINARSSQPKAFVPPVFVPPVPVPVPAPIADFSPTPVPLALATIPGFQPEQKLALLPLPSGLTPTIAPDEPNNNYKATLNMAVGRLLKRGLTKEDFVYEYAYVNQGYNQGGYRAAMRIPALPGALGQQCWVGKLLVKTKKEAEMQAAAAAVEALLEDHSFQAALAAPKMPNKWKAGGRIAIREQQNALSSMGPKLRIGIVLEEREIGIVDISTTTSLASVRVLIKEMRMRDCPENFLFCPGGTPVARDQEGFYVAAELLPRIGIVSEDLKRGSRRNRDAEGGRASSPPALPRRTAGVESSRDGERDRPRSRSRRGREPAARSRSRRRTGR